VKIKLDENLPRSASEVLSTAGHDVDTVVGEALRNADDPRVVSAATASTRLLLTLDRGLGDIRRYLPGSHSGVLVLRLRDQAAPSVRAAVEELLAAHDLESLAGTITVAQHGMLRIRAANPFMTGGAWWSWRWISSPTALGEASYQADIGGGKPAAA
jgi:predicted nuclease of predicted toxin-antitoxin system